MLPLKSAYLDIYLLIYPGYSEWKKANHLRKKIHAIKQF